MTDTPQTTTREISYRHALEDVANRLVDITDIIDSGAPYDAAAFLRATEKRCRRVLSGGEYGDAQESMMQEIANAK